MGDASLQQIQPGQLIADCYRLEEPIGRGAMGAVWRAVHVRLESPVAIKLLNSAIADDPEMLERFLREARSAAAVRSSHVVQIFDYGVDRDVPYIAMELLVGEPLDARLDARGVLEPPELDKIFTEVARAVGNAHAQGVVHRDIKPANIFIAREGDLEVTKVLDFGIAKLLDQRLAAPVGSGTHTGNILGTPNYMSPEQARGQRQVDHRSDLWSLAVLAFECLTGKQPFECTTLGDLVVKICTAAPPVPSEIAPVPEAFDAWFLKGMSKDPAGRFRSALEMADELHALLSAEGLGADSRSRGSTDRRFPPDRVEGRPRSPSAPPAGGATALSFDARPESGARGGDAPARKVTAEPTLLTSSGAVATEPLPRPRSTQRARVALVAAVLLAAALVMALGPGRALLAGPAPTNGGAPRENGARGPAAAGPGVPAAGAVPSEGASAARGIHATSPGAAVSAGDGNSAGAALGDVGSGDVGSGAAAAARGSDHRAQSPGAAPAGATPAGAVSGGSVPGGSVPSGGVPGGRAGGAGEQFARPEPGAAVGGSARATAATRSSAAKAARAPKAAREQPAAPKVAEPSARPPAPPLTPSTNPAPSAPFDPYADRL